MIQEIQSVLWDHTNPPRKIENRIEVCKSYIEELCSLVPAEFDTEIDEILFFKTIKPKFVSELEFYHRLYQAQLFSDNTIAYYSREITRMRKILADHGEFVNYYKNGNTNNDHAWFTRGQAPLPTSLCMLPWETNPKITSSRDSWISGLLSVERYIEHARDKVKSLPKSTNQ
ncbi:MAG: RteC domain-containing protein [Bacteroidota bacterium]